MKPADNSLEQHTQHAVSGPYTAANTTASASANEALQTAPLTPLATLGHPIDFPEDNPQAKKSDLSLFRFNKKALLFTVAGLLVIGAITAFAVLAANKNKSAVVQSGADNYAVGTLPVGSLQVSSFLLSDQADRLDVNGELQINNGFVIAPSETPASPATGQVYLSQDAQDLYFYNGNRFVNLATADSLVNTGVLSLQGVTGDLTLSAGTGIAINGTTITNLGVTSITGANGINVSSSTGTVTVSLPTAASNGLCLKSSGSGPVFESCAAGGSVLAGASQTPGRLTKFDTTTDVIVDSIVSESATNITVAGSLVVNSAVGGNVALLSASQIFAGANIFRTSANSTTGFQVQTSASATVLDVDTINSRVGIGTTGPGYRLDVQGGDVNTSGIYRVNGAQISSANLSNDANLAKLNASNIFSASNTFGTNVTIQGANSLTLGTSSNLGSVIFRDGSSANSASLRLAGALGAAATFQLPVAVGTHNICTVELGNCAGSGSGVTGSGTANKIAKFSAAQNVIDSSISDDGTTVTVGVGQVIQGSAGLTIGASGVNGKLVLNNSSNSNTLTLQSGANTSNLVFTLPTGDGGNGNCLKTNGLGTLSFAACTGGAGGGVTSINTLSGVLNLLGTTNQINVASSGGDTLTLSLPQDITTAGNVSFRTITLTGAAAGDNLIVGNAISGATGKLLDLQVNGVSRLTVDPSGNVNAVGQYQVNGLQISSSNLSNDANLAKLNGTGPQTFTGNNKFTGTFLAQNASNSVTSFQIQNAAGTSNLFNADTTNSRIGIGTAAPGYALDVNGDINTAGVYRINGVTVCSGTSCAAAAGSGNYIQNGLSQQTGANFNIDGSGVIGSTLGVTGVITGTTLKGVNGSGTNIAGSTLIVAGGQGTGNAAGGSLVFQYAPAGSSGASANALQTACTISGANGSLSCPGAGSNSERFGSGALSSGGNAVVFGRSTTANFAGSAIGYQATAASSGVALGSNTFSTGTSSIALGAGAYTQGTNSIALGTSATTGASDTSSIALGYSAATTAANQLVIGSSADAIQNVFIGKGVTNAAPTGFTLQATGGSGTNIAGASTTIAGGKGTGTGNGGNVNVQVAKPGSSGATANTLATVASFSGVNGAALFQNSADSTTAFQVQNAAGTQLITADTINDTVGIGSLGASTTAKLRVSSSLVSLRVNQTSTSNLLELQKSGTNVGLVDQNGNYLAVGAATATTGTTTGTGTNTTTLTLTTDAFAVNDVVLIDNVGQDYYTRITVDPGTGSYTVEPAVTFETTRTVTKYTIQNIGATLTDYTSNANKFFQGNFLGQLTVGTGTTKLSDGLLQFQGDTNLYRKAANELATDDELFTLQGTASQLRLGSLSSQAAIFFGLASDTNLYRSAANKLKTDDNFEANTLIAFPTGGAGTTAIATWISGGTENPFSISNDGVLRWGTSTTAFDTNLYRYGANLLKTDDTFLSAAGIIAQQNSGGEINIGAYGPSGEAAITFGNSHDVNLYRSAADVLKTDDRFDATDRGVVTYNVAGAPAPAWAVNGMLAVDNSNNRLYFVAGGNWRYAVDSASDERLKKNINTVDDSLSKILQTEIVNFQYNGDPAGGANDGKVHTGVIAQQVQGLFPEAMGEIRPIDSNGTTYLSVDYTKFVPHIIRAVQQQQNQINGLANNSGATGLFTNLNVSGAATINNLAVSGTATIASLNITGSAQFSGNLSVAGTATVNNLVVAGLTTINNLTVNGDAQFNGNITIGGHIITSGDTPTVAVAATAGDNAVCEISGNDTGGKLKITTGTGPAIAEGMQCTVTFKQAFGQAPNAVLSARNKVSAQVGVWVDSDTDKMTIHFASAPLANTTYDFSYFNTQ